MEGIHIDEDVYNIDVYKNWQDETPDLSIGNGLIVFCANLANHISQPTNDPITGNACGEPLEQEYDDGKSDQTVRNRISFNHLAELGSTAPLGWFYGRMMIHNCT